MHFKQIYCKGVRGSAAASDAMRQARRPIALRRDTGFGFGYAGCSRIRLRGAPIARTGNTARFYFMRYMTPKKVHAYLTAPISGPIGSAASDDAQRFARNAALK